MNVHFPAEGEPSANELTCSWCDFTGDTGCFDFRSDNSGFWCPDCDGFTFLDRELDHRRMLLLLEDKKSYERTPAPQRAAPVKTGLKKQLSPLRYPGGKSKAIDTIFHGLDEKKMHTFVEVFAGGASLGLSLLDAGKIQKLILNDLDPLVFNFWNEVLQHPDTLIDQIRNQPPTMDRFWKARQICRDFQTAPENTAPSRSEAAFSFLLLNRTAFSGIITANPSCGKDGTDEMLRQRWNEDTLIRRISRIAELAANMEVLQMDAATLVSERVGWLPEDTTLFVDPPYYAAGPSLYPTHFTRQDHVCLSDVLNTFYRSYPGPDIIITYDDDPFIRSLYPYADIQPLTTTWSLRRPNNDSKKQGSLDDRIKSATQQASACSPQNSITQER